jgi:putative transposase
MTCSTASRSSLRTGEVPQHIRSDIGPEFAAQAGQYRPSRVGVQTFFITTGSPWENG